MKCITCSETLLFDTSMASTVRLTNELATGIIIPSTNAPITGPPSTPKALKVTSIFKM